MSDLDKYFTEDGKLQLPDGCLVQDLYNIKEESREDKDSENLIFVEVVYNTRDIKYSVMSAKMHDKETLAVNFIKIPNLEYELELFDSYLILKKYNQTQENIADTYITMNSKTSILVTYRIYIHKDNLQIDHIYGMEICRTKKGLKPTPLFRGFF